MPGSIKHTYTLIGRSCIPFHSIPYGSRHKPTWHHAYIHSHRMVFQLGRRGRSSKNELPDFMVWSSLRICSALFLPFLCSLTQGSLAYIGAVQVTKQRIWCYHRVRAIMRFSSAFSNQGSTTKEDCGHGDWKSIRQKIYVVVLRPDIMDRGSAYNVRAACLLAVCYCTTTDFFTTLSVH